MNNQEKNKFKIAREFDQQHSVRGGFPTRDLANQYAALYRDAWGDNLVYLGADERDGLWFPSFNLYD